MNAGYLCKAIPRAFPHELLGYPVNDLKGILISISIISEINRLENEELNKMKKGKSGSFGQNRRLAKHRSLK